MAAKVAASLSIVVLVMVLGPMSSAAASGGGGCPPPITNSQRNHVAIVDFCFSPTVVYVQPGDEVTWTGIDPYPHTVTGANRAWGNYRKLRNDKTMTFRFDEAGVYPYYCVIHVGMVGTVVVGGDLGGSVGSDTAVDAVTRVRPDEPAKTSAVAPPAGAAVPWPLIVVGGATAVGAAARRVARRWIRSRR